MSAVLTYRVEKDAHRLQWLRLRSLLWPEVSQSVHAEEIASIVNEPTLFAAFLAELPNAGCVACAEVAIRHDYVNGCETDRVAFLEGIFVQPAYRKKGIARALCAAVEEWAISQGCSEFASDADVGNTTSYGMHIALGFTETERVVFFRKILM